jgi:hypothetical protein
MAKFYIFVGFAFLALYPICKGLLLGIYFLADCDTELQICGQLPFDESSLWSATHFTIEVLPFISFPLGIVFLIIGAVFIVAKLIFKITKSDARNTDR